MRKPKLLPGIGASIGMLLLILDGKTALAGARQGIELCLRTVIPSLFPFFILSGILTGIFWGSRTAWLRPVGKLCKIPEGAEPLLLIGLTGGYPIGAQCTADAWRQGRLSKADAERMLGFCSNAGPAFLFGMVAPFFPDAKTPWILWGIHILSALLTGAVLPGQSESICETSRVSSSAADPMVNALRAISSVCGWVVLFRVLTCFLEKWFLWLLPPELQTAVTGLLELSNGCCALASVENLDLRFLICSAMLAFGGICVTMQTFSVTKGLSMKFYLPGKLLQTALSLVLSVAYLTGHGLIAGVLLAICSLILRKARKKSSIPQAVGV